MIKYYSIILLLLLFAIVSCEEVETVPVQTNAPRIDTTKLSTDKEPSPLDSLGKDSIPPSGPARSNITGKVLVFEPCWLTSMDASGVQITLTDSASSKTIASTVSDQQGLYTLENIPEGTYNLFFEKDGFGFYKLFHRKHSAAQVDSVYNVQLAKEEYGIGSIKTISVNGYGDKLAVGGQIDRSKECLAVIGVIYFDTEPTVSHHQYKFTSGIESMYTIHYIPLKDIYAKGLQPGQTIYYTSYIVQGHSLPFFDPSFGVKIRSNIDMASQTPVYSFILP